MVAAGAADAGKCDADADGRWCGAWGDEVEEVALGSGGTAACGEGKPAEGFVVFVKKKFQ